MPSPKDDKRTFKEIVDVSGCCGYIAAPITVQGRAIGMLHADRPEPDGVVTMDHLDQLEAFAECLAVAFESAVLEEKASQQHIEVENLCAQRRRTAQAASPIGVVVVGRSPRRDNDQMPTTGATTRRCLR